MSREEELAREGWEKRFTIDETRLYDIVQQYEELGFEVKVEPLDLSSEQCLSCLISTNHGYRTIYTRRKR